MSHYALIEDGFVAQVVVRDGDESEATAWLNAHLGGFWVLGVRAKGSRAGIGYTYDEVRDAFIPPKPYESWVLNEDTCLWEAPTPKPDGDFVWDEQSGAWVEVEAV